MKLMVIIEGIARPYSPGDIFKKRGLKPISKSESTKPASSHPESTSPQSKRPFNLGEQTYEQAESLATPPKKLLVEARDIMSSPVITIVPECTTQAAWTVFTTNRFRHLPVSNDGRTILGIISDRDILRCRPSTDEQVHNLMSNTVLTATGQTSIREVARALFEERVGCMPILTEDGILEGIITRADILRALTSEAPLELWG